MKSVKVSLFITSLVVAALVASPVWAKKDLPAVNEEGMELVKDTRMTTIYADAGADLGIYKRIWLEDASVRSRRIGNVTRIATPGVHP